MAVEEDMATAQKIYVVRSTPRDDARVTFPNGESFRNGSNGPDYGFSVYSGPVGTPLVEYVEAAYSPDDPVRPILGAVVDNQLSELTVPVNRDVIAYPVTLRDSDGGRMYRRSLVFLMTAAANELWPDLKISVQHAIPSGGFYCEPMARPNFSEDEISRLRAHMLAIVERDEPFVRKTLPLTEAVAWFREHGDDDMVRLLENRDKDYVTVYTLRGEMDYLFGYMVPSTGYLKIFDLCASDTGFILRYPRRESPGALLPFEPANKLEKVFQQAKTWQALMGLPDIGALNRVILDGRVHEEILIAEALHSRFLSEIAEAIARRHAQGLRLVTIAGPSSSGKTTFSKRLAVQLMAYGIQPFTLAMDDYFVDRERTPRDEMGNFDFESLDALDRPRLNRDMLALMDGAEVQLPHFDFKAGKSKPGINLRLKDDHIIIAEGIHGLNPALLPDIPPDRVYRIYVSALTALNLDRHNRVATTDVRLLRRIVRDASRRGYSAFQTLERWESVRRGEKQYIFPFQENADVMFNSGLAYELAVLRPFAEPLLRQVEPNTPLYIEAKRLLSFLRWVRPAPPDGVPDDSLLREFVGGSVLESYVPGAQERAWLDLTNHSELES